MNRCAYCDVEAPLTLEHIIPDWYGQLPDSVGLDAFNARSPLGQRKGDFKIKDVCAKCNSGILSALDAYAKKCYLSHFSQECIVRHTYEFSFDLDLLSRWLLKVSFNSGRANNSDVEVLRQYRDAILNGDVNPEFCRIYAHCLAAIDSNNSPPQPALSRSTDGGSNRPIWFRISQFRFETEMLSSVVQRQVYVDSYCFTMLVADETHPSHPAELQTLERSLTNKWPFVERLDSSGTATLQVDFKSSYEARALHDMNFPIRYFGAQMSEEPEFSEAIESLVTGKISAIAIRISPEEIEHLLIEPTRGRLEELVSTREVAMAAMQRIAIAIDGFDDDARELWQIPDARNWLTKLFEACPFLPFLLAPETHCLKVIAICFSCDQGSNGTGTELHPDRLLDFLKMCFGGVNEVTQRFAISVEVNKAVSESISGLLKELQ